MKYIKDYLLFILCPGFFINLFILGASQEMHIILFGSLITLLFLVIFKKRITKETVYLFTGYNILSYLLVCLCFLTSQGTLSSPIWNILNSFYAPYFLVITLSQIISSMFISYIFLLCLSTFSWVYCFFSMKMEFKKRYIPMILCLVFSVVIDYHIFINSPSHKYKGHNFEYMNGYSSTDLSAYTPYATKSLLVSLDKESIFMIEKEEDMPILDGAEACYPVYSAIAKAVYKDIDNIELKYKDEYAYQNGKVVTFTNSSDGYFRLIEGKIDMFFGAKPSQTQLEYAKELGVEFDYTPIGKEAFVFFVNENNPIHNLSSQQVKDIYHGTFSNWEEVGGKNQKIIAFQRPENSGSQSMMNAFMKDVTLKEPLTYEMQSGMGGIIKEVAQYHNEDGAIGYTFQYFLNGLNQEKHVKILSIDGVYPNAQTVKNQSYPISTYLYCVTLKSNQKENVKKLKTFLLSSQGQYIIEKTGYYAIKE